MFKIKVFFRTALFTRGFDIYPHAKTLSWPHNLVLPRHFLLKFLYQDGKVSGHVLFCMSVSGEI